MTNGKSEFRVKLSATMDEQKSKENIYKSIDTLQTQLNNKGLEIKLDKNKIEKEFQEIKRLWKKYSDFGMTTKTGTDALKEFNQKKIGFANSYGSDLLKSMGKESGLTGKELVNFSSTINRTIDDVFGKVEKEIKRTSEETKNKVIKDAKEVLDIKISGNKEVGKEEEQIDQEVARKKIQEIKRVNQLKLAEEKKFFDEEMNQWKYVSKYTNDKGFSLTTTRENNRNGNLISAQVSDNKEKRTTEETKKHLNLINELIYAYEKQYDVEQKISILENGQEKKAYKSQIELIKEEISTKEKSISKTEKYLENLSRTTKSEKERIEVLRTLNALETVRQGEGLNLKNARQADTFTKRELNTMNAYEASLAKINGRLNEYRKTSKVIETQNVSEHLSKMIQTYKGYINVMKNSDLGSEKWEKAKKSAEKLRPVIDRTKRKLDEMNQSLQAQGKFLLNIKDSFKLALRSFSTYLSVTTIFYSTIRSLKEMVTQVANLDAAMVELRKVTNLTESQLKSFKKEAYEIANVVGRTGSEVINAEAEFARAGFDETEIANLAKVAIMLTNVGDGIDDVREASSSIISVLKAFNMEANESMHIIDALNEVSNNFAIDANNLTEVLERTSGTLGQTGTSYEELIGLTVGGYETLRNAEMVASGLNMISQRMRGMKEDGEAIEGLMPKIEKALQTYTHGQVTMMDKANGGLRSTYDVLKDLAKVYPTLSSEARAYLNEVIAGNRQNKVLVAIMENWENVEAAARTAAESAGSAEKENAKYLDSIAGKTAQLKNNLEQMATAFISSDLVKFIVDLGNGIVRLINTTGGLQNTLLAVIALLTVLFKKEIATFLLTTYKHMGSLLTRVKALHTEIKKNGGLINTFVKAIKGIGEAGFTAEAGLSAVVGGVGLLLGAISLGIAAYNKWKTQQQELRKERQENAKQNAENFEKETNDIDNLETKIRSLRAAYQNAEEGSNQQMVSKAALTSIQEELIKTYGDEAKSLDLVNGKLDDQLSILENIKKVKAQEILNENYAAYTDAENTLTKKSKTNLSVSGYAFAITDDIESYYKDIKKWLDKNGNLGGDDIGNVAFYGTIDERIDKLTEFKNKLIEIKEATKGSENDNFLYYLDEQIEVIENKLNGLQGEDYKNAQELVKQKAQLLLYTDDYYSKVYNNATKYREDYMKAVRAGDKEEIERTKQKMNSIKANIDSTLENSESLTPVDRAALILIQDILNVSTATEEATGNTEEYVKEADALFEATQKLSSSLSTVASALEEMDENGKLSLSTVLSLIDAGYSAALAFDAETGAVTIDKEAMLSLVRAKITLQQIDLTNRLQAAINLLSDEGEVALNSAAAYNILAKAKENAAKGEASDEEQMALDLQAQSESLKKVLDDLNKNGLSGLGSFATKSSSKSSKEWWEKQLDNLKEQFNNSEITIEEYIKGLERLQGQLARGSDAWKKVTQALNETKVTKVENDYKKGAISLEEYIRRLKELLSLYKEGSKAWNELASKIKSAQKELLSSYKSQFEQAHSAASDALDDEIDRLEKAREEQEKYYDERISALKEANEEQNKALELEKAMQALEKAKNEKTKRVWHEGQGWVWEADEEAIADAEKNLNDLRTEQTIDDLEKEKDAILKVYDEQIDAIEKYKESWDDITSDYESQQARLQAAQIMGANWERDILGQRLTTLEDFRNRYNALLAELGSYDNRSDANIALSGDVPQFSNGGKVDFTGMAMLHGSPSNPEWVLNNTQMENLIKTLNRPRVDRINSSVGQSSTYNYSFDKIVLPNVTNTSQFINALKNLNNVTNNQ